MLAVRKVSFFVLHKFDGWILHTIIKRKFVQRCFKLLFPKPLSWLIAGPNCFLAAGLWIVYRLVAHIHHHTEACQSI